MEPGIAEAERERYRKSRKAPVDRYREDRDKVRDNARAIREHGLGLKAATHFVEELLEGLASHFPALSGPTPGQVKPAKTAQIQAQQQLDGGAIGPYNDELHGPGMEPAAIQRGRPRFDGDTVSQDACRGPSPSLIRWNQT